MDITELTGIGEKRATSLRAAGLNTIYDLVNYFPRDYDDRSQIKTVEELIPDAVNTIRGTLATEPENINPTGRRSKGRAPLTITKAMLKDATGSLELVWFNQPYLKKYFRVGVVYAFTGRVKLDYRNRLQMESPDYEPFGENQLSAGRIVPVYTTPKGFSQKTFRALMNQALGLMVRQEKESVKPGEDATPFTDTLPNAIRQTYDLCSRKAAILNIHYPESDQSFLDARRHLVFEELFFMQMALFALRSPRVDANRHTSLHVSVDTSKAPDMSVGDDTNKGLGSCQSDGANKDLDSSQSDDANAAASTYLQGGITMPDTNCKPFTDTLPFTPTTAQQHVLQDIQADLKAGIRMNRLIQGDVGSGKTAVAMTAAYIAIKNNTQAAIMAPTEVLATQHYNDFTRYFEPLGIKTVLLTGSQAAKARREALAEIATNPNLMIVGTHALIQPGVEYARLGLVITDEQHRFGVNQRFQLTKKGQADEPGRAAQPNIATPWQPVDTATECPGGTQADADTGLPQNDRCITHTFGRNNYSTPTPDMLPHTLVMTATPIPRTLALILYGDLDISIIDELPPGRQPIKTYCVDSRYRQRLHEFIRKEAVAGRQAYVICPAIDESPNQEEILSPSSPSHLGNDSESSTAIASRASRSNASPSKDNAPLYTNTEPTPSRADIANVLAYTAALSAALPDLNITCLHGKMKPALKQEIMNQFKAGEIHALVATTVIEVGVHAPNANLIIIENAERFGLSQLHQLRGRVGRGKTQAYCVLVTDAKNQVTKARMKAMTDTTDGFRLAELDLAQRGAGDFFGTRQHGLPDFQIANLYRDVDILKIAQSAAHVVHRGEIALFENEVKLLEGRVALVPIL